MTDFSSSELSKRLCLGIDPSLELLESWKLPKTAAGARRLAEICLEAATGVVSYLKPQVAFFEQFGSAGFRALEHFCAAAKESGMVVIADAKRSDIGSSLAGYTRAWLQADSPFSVSALTVSPFLGVQGLSNMVDSAASCGRTVFVLVATSNPEGKSIQAGSGRSLSFQILSELIRLAKAREALGVVIGANLNLRDYGLQRIKAEPFGFPILAPGFGFQGARLADCSSIFGVSSQWVIPNVGRGVLLDGPDQLRNRLNEQVSALS